MKQIKFQCLSPRASHVTILFVVDPHLRSTLATEAINFCIKRTAGALNVPVFWLLLVVGGGRKDGLGARAL